MISAVGREADGASSSGSNGGNLVSEVSAASPATCVKSKEDRKGKNVIRGWKRERDRDAAASPAAPPLRPRKEKPGDGSSPPPAVFLAEHHLCRDCPGHCHCAGPDSRMMGDSGNIIINNSNVNNNNHCNGAAGKATLDCGVKSGGAIVVRRQHDDTPAAKKHRGAEKVRGLSFPYCCHDCCLEALLQSHQNQQGQ